MLLANTCIKNSFNLLVKSDIYCLSRLFSTYNVNLIETTQNHSKCIKNHLDLKPHIPNLYILRNNVNFFNKLPAARLWKGLTSVSNAGMKKGRGKGNKRKLTKNLNLGQYLGEGEANIVWPGLNAPILRGREVVKQETLPKDEEREKKLIEIRDKMAMRRSKRLSPLERGWSGNKMPGRSIGPPNPIGEEKFDGFDTVVLELKTVCKMDGKLGRIRRKSMLAVTGNKNGLIGFAVAKSEGTIDEVSRLCKKAAAKRLVYIQRCDNHTVFHDFHCKYLHTKIWVHRKPEGFGLRCHRAIKEICKMVGIKNLYAKVEGSVNVQNITKAFILGLLNQRTHQDFANEKRLHVVRVREGDFPRVVASPQDAPVRNREELSVDEELDFKLYAMDRKVKLEVPRPEPFYTKLPSYEIFLKKEMKRRNHQKIKLQQIIEYGKLVSFLTEKHPEADALKKIVVDDD